MLIAYVAQIYLLDEIYFFLSSDYLNASELELQTSA